MGGEAPNNWKPEAKDHAPLSDLSPEIMTSALKGLKASVQELIEDLQEEPTTGNVLTALNSLQSALPDERFENVDDMLKAHKALQTLRVTADDFSKLVGSGFLSALVTGLIKNTQTTLRQYPYYRKEVDK